MATITLTDRISVRVTAKDSTETSNQNKTNGGNVASALGGSGLTDSEKEELGESLGETVTDENGTTYARSDKVAGVLKQIADAGKLSEPSTTYKYGNVSAICLGNLPSFDYINMNPGIDARLFGPAANVASSNANYAGLPVYFSVRLNASNTQTKLNEIANTYVGIIEYEGIKYFVQEGSFEDIDVEYLNNGEWAGGMNRMGRGNGDSTDGWADLVFPVTTVGEKLLSLSAYGQRTEVTTGGAKLDPTGKTDEQIQRELEQAASTNGTIQTIGNDSYIAVTDANGNPLYFLGT